MCEDCFFVCPHSIRNTHIHVGNMAGAKAEEIVKALDETKLFNRIMVVAAEGEVLSSSSSFSPSDKVKLVSQK